MTRIATRIGIVAAHVLLLAFVLGPVLWALRTSLSGAAYDLSLVPREITFANYAAVAGTDAFQDAIRNSFVYAASVLVLVLLINIPAGYAFARLRFRGRSLSFLLLALPLLPFVAILVPLTYQLSRYGLIDQMSSVILVTTAFQLPFTCWMLRNFFQSVPRSLEEAAFLDGCSRVKAIYHVVLPASFSGIIAVSVYSFLSTWLSYLIPFALVSTPKLFSLSQMLLAFEGQYGTNYPALTAAAMMTLAVPLILFAAFQRWFVAGMFGVSSR